MLLYCSPWPLSSCGSASPGTPLACRALFVVLHLRDVWRGGFRGISGSAALSARRLCGGSATTLVHLGEVFFGRGVWQVSGVLRRGAAGFRRCPHPTRHLCWGLANLSCDRGRHRVHGPGLRRSRLHHFRVSSCGTPRGCICTVTRAPAAPPRGSSDQWLLVRPVFSAHDNRMDFDLLV